jgi:hypothetical protein
MAQFLAGLADFDILAAGIIRLAHSLLLSEA